jgi:hypothetical protein
MMLKAHKFSLLGIVLVIAVISCISALATFWDNAETSKDKYNDAMALNDALRADVSRLVDRTVVLTEELEICRKQTKEPRQKNREDLIKYIQMRHSMVPVEIAVLVANQLDGRCQEYGADFALMVGIMEVESAFNPFAISKVKARGLMQVLPKVWRDHFKVEKDSDFHDIEFNIRCGIQIFLKYLKDENGNNSRALNRYNGSDPAKGSYANDVFAATGRFVAYSNSIAPAEDPVEEEKEEEVENVRNPEIPEEPKVPNGA